MILLRKDLNKAYLDHISWKSKETIIHCDEGRTAWVVHAEANDLWLGNLALFWYSEIEAQQ